MCSSDLSASNSAEVVARRALAAAREAFRSLDAVNAGFPPERTLSFGIALHVGEVAYGNVGGLARLDFTCIGPAVNLASLIEGLNAQVGRRLLISEEMAELVGGAELVGTFHLKGVDEPQRVYAPGG